MKEGIHPNYREVCFVDLSNGFKFVTRSCANTKEMVKMDDDYVDNLSPLRDVQIILKTPFALMRQMKACARARGTIKSQSPARSSRPSPQAAFVLSMSTTQKLSD